jgi:hypothetical protein
VALFLGPGLDALQVHNLVTLSRHHFINLSILHFSDSQGRYSQNLTGDSSQPRAARLLTTSPDHQSYAYGKNLYQNDKALFPFFE